MLDIEQPVPRIGRAAIDAAGFQFIPECTALCQIESLGLSQTSVTDIVLTHGDHDHAGGLADFPQAKVHVSSEELAEIERGSPRYSAEQFSHSPMWDSYSEADGDWFGLPSRRLELAIDAAVHLIWLPGHTIGHCGVAVETSSTKLLYVGDAYYLREELNDRNHPIGELATIRAEDNVARLESLDRLRKFSNDHSQSVEFFGYHDVTELPAKIPRIESFKGI
ncbi:Metallo-beta-lactamase superfamily protein [Crateriforma conspicua]|nr:Metallo-beta-lactamase superfamily protein [Crateriforma conspicua]